ncbi:flagellar hook-associated protein FlgK [Clostridium rectalis]|uniref:flagellar hook-associated protein FlgK n=1 Tax=Clostridium rectalis TaxID=2040295 RepID=UPI000F635262|nr:flagellar hook-associated protein FlgK [Clostridium rectalis]
MSGLFGTINTGKSGIFASQKAIDVTSHNIANANTDGYSRQRAKLQTRRPFCTPAFNNAVGPGQMGTGVEVSEIERIRDAFIDYQVRVELGVNGEYSQREKFLSELESIFNEPSDTGISDILGNFFSVWHDLGGDAQTSSTRALVAEQANALAEELNHKYEQMQKLKGNAQDIIKQSVFDVNSILDQIKNLDEEIVQVSAAGNNPNDLLDKRDLLLDELSSKFGIKIDKKNYNGMDVSTKDDPNAQPPGGLNLVQHINPEDVARFGFISKIEPKEGTKPGEAGTYTVTYYKYGDMTSEKNKVTLDVLIEDDADLSKEGAMTAEQKVKKLEEGRVLWTNKDGLALDKEGKPALGEVDFSNLAVFTPSTGEIKGYSSVQQEIDNNINQLNKLAKALAYAVNAVHSQSENSKEDDLPFFVNGNVAKYDDSSNMVNLDDILNGEIDINAGNISINKSILKNPMLIKAGKTEDGGENNGLRATAIAGLRDKLMEIQSIQDKMNREEFINKLSGGFIEGEGGVLTLKGNTGGMKVDNFFKDTVNKLGIQVQDARRVVKNKLVVLSGFEERRASVSGVSMDEEMANLIQFQHAYQSNAKIISTVDELLDVVVNGLKR